MGKKRPKREKRGFPIALLVAFGEGHHTYVKFWQIFSIKTKPLHPAKLDLGRKIKYATEKQIYGFFEEITQAYKPLLAQGVQSILLVSDLPRDLPSEYLQHIQKHYRWMTHNPRHPIQFGKLQGKATEKFEVDLLREREDFQELLRTVQDEEETQILNLFEQRIAHEPSEPSEHPSFLVGLAEIEQFIYGKSSESDATILPEYILVTEPFLRATPHKNRLNRLLQIAENRAIKSRIISEDSLVFSRVDQFGGLLCFMESDRSFQIRTKTSSKESKF